MTPFTFEDMKKIERKQLGSQVPLELFRTVRLIGMFQGLPLEGKGTTLTVGRKIGESLPVNSIEELLELFEELKIGIPRIVQQDAKMLRICDLEGAILEGAVKKLTGRSLTVRETMCNVSGHDHCEYEIRFTS